MIKIGYEYISLCKYPPITLAAIAVIDFNYTEDKKEVKNDKTRSKDKNIN